MYLDNIQYGVLRKEVQELSLSGTLEKTIYTAGDYFDSTGLSVTARFNDDTTKDVTKFLSWTPLRLTEGLTEITGSYGGKVVTVSGLTVNKGIDDFSLEGKQLISHTRNGVTYYLDGGGKSTIYSCDATVFDFELIYTNTFSIKTPEGKYLQTTSSTTISLGDEAEYWQVTSGTIKNDDDSLKGSFDLKGLNNNRYLALVISGANTDFRGYLDSTQSQRLENSDATSFEENATKALLYADYFLKTTDSLCVDYSKDNLASLKSVWSDLETKFNALTGEVQTLIRDFDVSKGSGNIKKALQRYDHVITRYGTGEDGLNNFIIRDYSSIAINEATYQNSATTIVIVSLSVFFVSALVIGSALIIRKRRTN